jgi:hypothetical protein
MKKFIVFAVALALMMLPAVAFAKTEFSLGGYIKMDTFWDSSQNHWAMLSPVNRDNTVQGTHGRLNMRAQESRFNFTIKGPKFMGAVVTGFIEMDFDTADFTGAASGAYNVRVRHAMFRLDWPETELLLGQYWGLFDNYIPDGAQDGAMIPYTTAFDRIPQIRLTQKFFADWQVAGLIGLPIGAGLTNANPYGNSSNGMAAETPQVQGMIKYSHDWWGKAAYFGHPQPFTASVSAGWQRNISRFSGAFGLNALGENNYVPTGGIVSQKFVSPWMVKGGLFIPVLATHTANLANTASIMTSWFVGQGVEAFGMYGGCLFTNGAIPSALYKLQYQAPDGTLVYTPTLQKRFGGMVQAQYYFTNEWYANVAYGITRNYGVNANNNINPVVNEAFSGDQMRTMQEVDATLWYRPIQALKFGVQYSYCASNYFQKQPGNAGAGVGVGTDPNNVSDKGQEHRVEVVGYFFF